MKLFFLFLFLATTSIVFSQGQTTVITATSEITTPGIKDGTTTKRYLFSINSPQRDELKEIWLKDDHIFSAEKMLLNKGMNILVIEYWINQFEGTVFTKITLNSVDITEICFLEPMDQDTPYGIFKFKENPPIKLTKFDQEKVNALP